MTYKVDLPVYNGPMDLLLYLIRRDEVDIRDIEVARVADQYVAYLDALRDLDIEVAADFLVMAATLLEMKSRALLPRPPAEEEDHLPEDEEDPRETLIRQLLEYRRFKEAAGHLSDRGHEMARRFPRGVDERLLRDLAKEDEVEAPAADLLEGVEVWDIFEAFSQVVRTLGYARPREVVYDETPVEEAADDLIVRLEAERSILFVDLFDREKGRGYAMTLFLALLELMRQRRVGVEQEADFRDIRIYLRDPESETYRPTRPRGAGASADGLKRSRPRRPTERQREALHEMMEDVELGKTEFDTILDSVEVPDVEPFRPIYSKNELLGKTDAEAETEAEEDTPVAPENEPPAGPEPPLDETLDAPDDEDDHT